MIQMAAKRVVSPVGAPFSTPCTGRIHRPRRCCEHRPALAPAALALQHTGWRPHGVGADVPGKGTSPLAHSQSGEEPLLSVLLFPPVWLFLSPVWLPWEKGQREG